MTVQEKLKFEADRFFGSGMKRHWFTAFLYEAFYVESNLFIAHYDKSGFFAARFDDPNGLRETISLLRTKPKNEAHRVLSESLNTYIEPVQKAGSVSELQVFNTELNTLIGRSYFIPLKYSGTRQAIRDNLISVQKQIEELIQVESERII